MDNYVLDSRFYTIGYEVKQYFIGVGYHLLLLLLGRPPFPYGMLIVGWWCSINLAENKRTLDSVPIVTVLF